MALKVGELFATLNVKDDGFQKKMSSATSSFMSLAAKAVSAAATLNTIKLGVNYNAQLEQLQTSFEVMTGSATDAEQILERIRDLGASTPFEMQGLAQTTQLLMNYGLGADTAIDSMMMLGDIAQGDQDKLTRIATAYGQMSSAGKVALEDIKQMIEAGYNPLQEISETTGESMASLYDRISKGTISIDEITASMKRSTSAGGKYFKSMEKQSKTLNGQLSTLQDTAMQLLGDVVSPINDVLTDSILPASIDAVESIQEAFSEGGFAGVGRMMMTEIADGFESAARNLYAAAASIDLGEIWSGVRSSAGELQSNIRETLGKIKLKASELMSSVDWAGIWDGVTDTASTLQSKAAAAITAVSIKASDYWTGVDWSGIWDGITGTYEALKTKAGEILGKLPGIVGGFIEDAANFTESGQFAALGENIVNFLAAGIESKAGGGAAKIINALSGLFDELNTTEIGANLRIALGNLGEVALNAIVAGIGAVEDGAAQLATALGGLIDQVDWTAAGTYVAGLALDLVTNLVSGLAELGDGGLGTALGTMLGQATNAVAEAATGIASAIAKWILSADTWVTLGKSLGALLAETVSFGLSFMIETMSGFGERLAALLDSLFPNIDKNIEIGIEPDLTFLNTDFVDSQAQQLARDAITQVQYALAQDMSEEEVALFIDDIKLNFGELGLTESQLSEINESGLYASIEQMVQEYFETPIESEVPITTTPVVEEEADISSIESLQKQLAADIGTSVPVAIKPEITEADTAELTASASAQIGSAGTEAGTAFGTNVSGAIAASLSSVTASVNDVINSVKAAANSGFSSMANVGLDFARGLAAGIRTGQSVVTAAARSIAQAAADAAKDTLQIHSPSRVTMGFGRYFGEGFAKGITGTTSLAVGAAGDLARSAAGAATIRNPGSGVRTAYSGSAGARESIDYNRLGASIAEAIVANPAILMMDGEAVARINRDNVSRANNTYLRSVALGYGK